MIPPPPSKKPIAFYDTECYPNFWLLKIRAGARLWSFAIRDGESLSAEQCYEIDRLFGMFTVVSFNGNYYDVPMLAHALGGYSTSQLKWISDQLIIYQVKPWDLPLNGWCPKDHIDIIEVAPGAGSQKQYAGRIHCKTMRDLPFDPDTRLSLAEIIEVSKYCENDLSVLSDLFYALAPQIEIREAASKRYGVDLRSKSDAQMGEAILKVRCEQALGYRIFKPEIDWNLKFRYEPPAFLSFSTPALTNAFEIVKNSVFGLGPSGAVTMPAHLDGLSIGVGTSVYRMGIGGLHSSEKCQVYRSNETHVLSDIDVRGYYPRLMINSGRYPKALGPAFTQEFEGIVTERNVAKDLEAKFKKAGVDSKNPANKEAYKAYCENEGGKIVSNGSFGKTGSPYSTLFAPEMLIQTTITGQLSILMLIEWFEHYGIPVISANTDGLVSYCPRSHIATRDALIKEWEARTGLEMEMSEYAALYSRDVNNYFAVKTDGSVKRKGEYSKAGLVEKKNPDVEICSDAAAEYLAHGTPLLYTIASCLDISKFVTVRKVTGGGVKMWGEGPRKETKVRDMTEMLQRYGWVRVGRKWEITGKPPVSARAAYESCFEPQRPEYLGKVIRWFYSTEAPGPIVYKTNGNAVGLSYGAKPCMTLPDSLPADIDYSWYLATAEGMLREVGAEI